METFEKSKTQSWLSWFLRGLIILVFIILLGRLIELQIIKGTYYKKLSENNRVKKVVIPAPRGKIIARGGEVLIDNKEVKKDLVFNEKEGIIKTDYSGNLAEEYTISEWVRYYPLGASFFHAGGYVGEVSESEVGRIRPECFSKGPLKMATMIGKTGLEKQYDCVLSGVDGEELLEVDTSGKIVRVLGQKVPIPGVDLQTNIDYGLQQKVAEEMVDKKGAVVVTDTKGEVLAFFSGPSFDPNIFNQKEASSKITAAFNDLNLPFFNRVIGGMFHPGSVFKPLVALAGLSTKKIDINYIYTDTGIIKVNDFSYTNWYFTQYGGTEGSINIVRALARSTDTFFYNLGELLGPETISQWSNKFGLGKETEIDLPGEIKGLVPTPEWKQETQKERWFLGNTYHMAIGQGYLALTPIAENQMIVALANGGSLCTPSIKATQKENCQNLRLDKKDLDIVIEGMRQVCASGGTGYTFFDFTVPTACKTGTAEINTDGKTHAWFVAFAPIEYPQIVATVLVEEGGEGSKEAGPVARNIFDYWFAQHP
jgi:penicillin-binding protein 2